MTRDRDDFQIAEDRIAAEAERRQTLNCSDTRVGILAPLAALSALQSLDCSDTNVGDLALLAALIALRTLDCSDTSVGDLTPLAALDDLIAYGFQP